ncbi:MAG TPA: hypothetical protein VGF48_00830 [Thermoanaerobaculia bacterium]|jgi:hypothetical protein
MTSSLQITFEGVFVHLATQVPGQRAQSIEILPVTAIASDAVPPAGQPPQGKGVDPSQPGCSNSQWP